MDSIAKIADDFLTTYLKGSHYRYEKEYENHKKSIEGSTIKFNFEASEVYESNIPNPDSSFPNAKYYFGTLMYAEYDKYDDYTWFQASVRFDELKKWGAGKIPPLGVGLTKTKYNTLKEVAVKIFSKTDRLIMDYADGALYEFYGRIKEFKIHKKSKHISLYVDAIRYKVINSPLKR